MFLSESERRKQGAWIQHGRIQDGCHHQVESEWMSEVFFVQMVGTNLGKCEWVWEEKLRCLDAPIYLDDVWMSPVHTQHKERILCQTKKVSTCPHTSACPLYINNTKKACFVSLRGCPYAPIDLDATICLDTTCMLGCHLYVYMLPYVWRHPLYVWMPPYVWIPPYVWTPLHVWLSPYV